MQLVKDYTYLLIQNISHLIHSIDMQDKLIFKNCIFKKHKCTGLP